MSEHLTQRVRDLDRELAGFDEQEARISKHIAEVTAEIATGPELLKHALEIAHADNAAHIERLHERKLEFEADANALAAKRRPYDAEREELRAFLERKTKT
jgi:hypothetical protein